MMSNTDYSSKLYKTYSEVLQKTKLTQMLKIGMFNVKGIRDSIPFLEIGGHAPAQQRIG